MKFLSLTLVLIGLFLSHTALAFGGGTDVGNGQPTPPMPAPKPAPAPGHGQPHNPPAQHLITLDGADAEAFVDNLQHIDSELFSQSFSLDSSSCTADGFGGRPVTYSGNLTYTRGDQSLEQNLSDLQAHYLCEALSQAGVMKFEPPNPSGLYSLGTQRIECELPDAKCEIWL